MHIGIDARSIFTGGGGDRTYFRNLITAMARLSPGDRWTLYAEARDPDRDTLRAANVTVADPLPAPINALWNMTALVPRLRHDRVDLLHSQYMLPPLGPVPCPMIVTIHDVTFRLFPAWFPARAGRIQNLLIPQSARRAARVLTGSQSAASDIARTMGVAPAKIAVTPYGLDARFCPAPPDAQSDVRTRHTLPPRYVLGVGLLRARKNVAVVLRAMQTLLAQNRWPADVVLALTGGWGGGTAEAALLVEADPALKAQVRTLGFVADADLPALYTAALGSVYPSLYEGFGFPVLEAMACGCPVLCSDTSSLPEVAGDAAPLLPPEDVPAWAAALDTLLTDSAERARLQQRGRAQAAQFTWERCARETLALYRAVVEGT